MSLFERIRKGCPELTGRFSPTLDLYILRIFLGVYVVNLLSFCLIFVLIDLVENLDNFNRQADSLGELFSLMFRYYGINLPIIFCQVLGPIVCLASGLFTLTMLQRSNELIPILANGRSYRRLFMPVLFAACLVSAGTFLIQDRWLPGTREAFSEMSSKRKGKLEVRDLKYKDTRAGILVLIKRYLINEQRAEGVLVLPTRPGKQPDSVIQAEQMQWVQPSQGGGYWLMKNGWIARYEPFEFSEGAPRSRLVTLPQPEVVGGADRLSESFIEQSLETGLLPGDLEAREAQIAHMSLADLRRKMETEDSDRSWKGKYYARIFHPVHNLVLLLLGLPAIIYSGTSNIFFGAFLAACLGTAYFVVGAFCQELGAQGLLSPAIGAVLGPLLFLALSLTWWRDLPS
ncbi:MAG: LptF/LptG family permease [Planctomycetota bacterium]|nr:LptF/LptG family permease [Planctomycetota bacterium]